MYQTSKTDNGARHASTAQDGEVLVLAPRRDGCLIVETLAGAGLTVRLCSSLAEVTQCIEEGAGAAVIAEEALRDGTADFARALREQPSWSDFPLVLLVENGPFQHDGELLEAAILLPRPLTPEILLSAVRVAMRSRQRQYQLKAYLSADEQRASEVLDGMLDGYVALDRQWRCLYINRRGSQTLGLGPEELIGTDIRTMMPHWAETGFDERLRQVLDGGEPFSCEEWCPISEKWFEVRCGRSLDGLSIFFFDISARKAAEAERLRAERNLQETKDQLELAVRSTKLGIWDWDLRTNELHWSPLCKAIFGFSAKTRIDYGRFLTHVHPDDRALVQDTISRCLDPAIRQDYDLQFRTGLPGKAIRWVLARGRPYFEGNTPVRFIGTALDITGEKAVEEQLRLLVNELSHRVKNTLAVIQTIADRTLSGNGPVEPMREAFIGRLHALADTHSLLTASKWECVDLGALVHESLGHMASCDNAKVRATGSPVSLAAKASLAMGMTLHELGTNAAKYGALSVEGGEVDIRWEVMGDALVLEWNECGLAGVAPPTRQGFGSRLIKQAVQYDLGGVIHQEFRPSGLQCRLTIPTLSALAR